MNEDEDDVVTCAIICPTRSPLPLKTIEFHSEPAKFISVAKIVVNLTPYVLFGLTINTGMCDYLKNIKVPCQRDWLPCICAVYV